ncbi:MAG: hypothetical protein WCJ56_05650 [bacterium]
MKQKNWLQQLPTSGKILMIVILAIICWQLFVPPIVGLADNGDYDRVMMVGKLVLPESAQETAYLDHINLKYTVHPEDTIIWYWTSQLFLVKGAVLVNQIFTRNGLFDLRLIGVAHTFFFLLAIAGLLWATRGINRTIRITLYVLFTLIFCDIAYTAHFNSFYSEPGGFVFFFLTLAVAGVIINLQKQQGIKWSWLFWLFAISVMFITSKAQNVFLSIPFAMLIIILARSAYKPAKNRAGLVLATILVLLSGLYYAVGRSEEVTQCNLYHMVFFDILRNSTTPSADLAALGLDQKYLALAGTHWFTPNIPIREESFKRDFFDKIGYGTILKFYTTHPVRMIETANRGAIASFSSRPGHMGNYEKAAGYPPKAKSDKFSYWSSWKENLPGAFKAPFLIIFSFLNVIVWWFRNRYYAADSQERAVGYVHLTLIIAAFMEFFIVILGDGGGEIVHHMLIFTVMCEACLLLLIAYLIAAIQEKFVAEKENHADAVPA